MRPGRRHRTYSGQTTTEAALVFPIMLMLAFGLVEGAIVVYQVAVLDHLAHVGSRVAALPGTPSESAVQAAVVDAATKFHVQVVSANVAVQPIGAATFAARQPGQRIRVSISSYRPVSTLVFGNVAAVAVSRQSERVVE
jgi:Flp pilus assembly protein TadG